VIAAGLHVGLGTLEVVALCVVIVCGIFWLIRR
jgi:hypothetical protein